MAITLPMPLYALLPLGGLAAVATYSISLLVHSLFITPLRHIPGPAHVAWSEFFFFRLATSGTGHHQIQDLHKKYGPVVRVGPYHVSINHPDGMKQLRGHRKSGEHGKDASAKVAHDNIIGANRADHQVFRRAMSHAFSAQSLLEQQPIILGYISTLMSKLREHSADGKPLDIVQWVNYSTFDIVGDLSFGEPFGCLESAAYHPWVELIFDGVKNMSIVSHALRLPWMLPLLLLMIPRDLARKFGEHKQLSTEKVRKRMAMEQTRPDFMNSMMRKAEATSRPMTFDELVSNASLLIIAGSETTGTQLSAAAFYLGKLPDKQAKLAQEIRSTFKSEDDIDMISTQNLTYLSAVINECLRIFPPVPVDSSRKIDEGGDTILDTYLPAGTSVDVWQYAVHRNHDHFYLADDFIPERWTGEDKRFENDAKQALQPFSMGPRSCLGKNLAYAEMRVILARMIWNFDIKVSQECLNWDIETKVFNLWEKGPVNVYLTRSPESLAVGN